MSITGCSIRMKNILARLSEEDVEEAVEYIQNAVDDYCIRNKDLKLSVRILFGGVNRDWGGTPLQKIYDYHVSVLSKNPKGAEAKDVGC